MGKITTLAVLLLAAAFSGCATTTTIVTNPPGATVEKAGVKLGQTPLRYETKMNIFETEDIQVTSPSGEMQKVTLRRSEIDPLPFVGGLGLCFCFGYTGIGLVGLPIYIFGGWKLPETTLVSFGTKPAALPPAPPSTSSAPTVASASEPLRRRTTMGY